MHACHPSTSSGTPATLHACSRATAPPRSWDLKLQLAPPVAAALHEALVPLRRVVEAAMGERAVLHECAALVADPRAPRQPMHPDSPYSSSCAMLTVFVALQDVDESMGPTVWLPGTHSRQAHTDFNAPRKARRAPRAKSSHTPQCFSPRLNQRLPEPSPPAVARAVALTIPLTVS